MCHDAKTHQSAPFGFVYFTTCNFSSIFKGEKMLASKQGLLRAKHIEGDFLLHPRD